MYRVPVFVGTFVLCGLLVGCGSDSREALVGQTVSLMNEAATETETVRKAIDKAVDDAKGDNAKLDLTEAGKATEPLLKTGKKLQEMKQHAERLRNTITDDEREENAKNYRGKVVTALDGLNVAKDDLQKSLAKAEKMNRKKADELRTKIREAEAPYEAIARQGQ